MELPKTFVETTQAILEADYEAFQQALLTEPSVSVRLNTQRGVQLRLHVDAVAWCPTGYYLNERPSFTFDPLFHAGVYYVQEASSMFLSQVIRTQVQHPVVALDMCAAPGGKSTLLCDTLPKGSLLVTNEYVRSRSQILAENITKWGNPNVFVTNNGAESFAALGPTFDFVLVDAPCSGEGMFRKDEVAIQEWSPSSVWQCVERQRSILSDVWQALKPGGLLVYSTCTFNLQENEGNVKWLQDTFQAQVLPVPVEDSWGIIGSLAEDFNAPVYRFMPHKTRGEGLFMTVLKKPEEELYSRASCIKKNKKKGKGQPVPNECKAWVTHSEEFYFCWYKDKLMAINKEWQSLWDQLSEQLHVLQAGITVATQKGKDFIPEHALALSLYRNTQAFPTVELTYAQAIAYLRKEVVVLDAQVPKGYVCVTYREVPLGWVKNLGNRANNLYPDPWRIRSGYIPEEQNILSNHITLK